MPELLAVERLTAGYGEARVIQDLSFTLADGQSLALLGRNGVGKTTLIDTLIGVTTRFAGRHRARRSRHQRPARPMPARAPASAGRRRSATSSAR